MRFDPQSNTIPESRAERLLRPKRRWMPMIGKWLINLLVALLCMAVPVAGYWVWKDYISIPPGDLGGTDLAVNTGEAGVGTSGPDTATVDSTDHARTGHLTPVRDRLTPSQAACARGQALLESGKPGQAIQHFQDAVRINPEFAQAHYGLALAYVMSNDPESARAQREILARQDENLARLLDNLIN